LHFNHLTTPLTRINKSTLVNEIHLTIEINTNNHFLNDRVKLKKDIYFEMEGILLTSLTSILRTFVNTTYK